MNCFLKLFLKSLPLSVTLLAAIFWYTDTLLYFFARDTYLLVGIISFYCTLVVWRDIGRTGMTQEIRSDTNYAAYGCLLLLIVLAAMIYYPTRMAPVVVCCAFIIVCGLHALRTHAANRGIKASESIQPTSKPMMNHMMSIVVWVTFSIILAVYVMVNLHNRNIDSDEIRLIFDAKLITQGLVPFRDFNARAAALIYPLALMYRWFGMRIMAYRVGTAVIAWGSAVVLYQIAKRHVLRWQALLMSVIYAALPVALNFLYIKTETFEVFLGLLSVLCFVVWTEHRDCGYMRYLSHLCMLLALLIRPTAVFFYLFHIALSIHDLEPTHWAKEIRRHLVEIIAVGLLFVASTYTFFRSHNSLVYTNTFKQFGIDVFSYMRFLLTPSYVPLTVIVIATIATLQLFRKGIMRMPKLQLAAAVMILVLLVAYIGNALVLGFWPQYYMDFAVPLAILVTYAIIYLAERSRHVPFYVTCICIALGTSFAPSYLSLHAYFASNNIPVAELQQVASIIDAHSNPNDTIFGGNPEFALFSDRQQFLNLSHSYYDSATSAYVIGQLRSHPPRIIVADAEYLDQYYVGQPDFDGLIASCYSPVGAVGTPKIATVYALRSAPSCRI